VKRYPNAQKNFARREASQLIRIVAKWSDIQMLKIFRSSWSLSTNTYCCEVKRYPNAQKNFARRKASKLIRIVAKW